MSKEYGLIIPGKQKQTIQAPGKRASIFDEDSSSADEDNTKPIFKKPTDNKTAQEKLINEDPTIYQYDEIYDEIEKKRDASKLSQKTDKKPKYINNLLKAAERRKRENELRIEREVHREREAEGDKFKDKESYVTPSYQKKLEELRALEEEEKREEYLESIGDVRKQGNLDGFYRHLYEQKMNEIEPKEATKPKEETKTKRHYRSRGDSNSEDETVVVKKEHMNSNLDADSDFSIDSSSENEDEKEEVKVKSEVIEEETEKKQDEKVEETKEIAVKNEDKVEPVEKKPKLDIWKKRTVGEVLENARQRYFERKALRESG